jgi:hypothetical protein
MRPLRVLVAAGLLAALTLMAGDTGAQPKDSPVKPAAKGQLPTGWDRLGLSDAQRAEVLKVTAEYREKTDKLREEIRKLDEEAVRKRVAVLTDDQRKKLIDLVAGPEPKAKADPKAKAKDK